jgi:hypothetical protein
MWIIPNEGLDSIVFVWKVKTGTEGGIRLPKFQTDSPAE